MVKRCVDEDLVGGEGFGVDASLIPANANQTRGVETKQGLPFGLTSRAIDKYLETLDDAAFGAATKVVPRYTSPVDPAARWTGADGGMAYFAYSTNHLVDLENAVIIDVEPTVPIRPAETLAARCMIDRVRERFNGSASSLSASLATPATARRRCWARWSRSAAGEVAAGLAVIGTALLVAAWGWSILFRSLASLPF